MLAIVFAPAFMVNPLAPGIIPGMISIAGTMKEMK
jgi:hypothetical protein